VENAWPSPVRRHRHALYQFVWHEYCDWYLEMAKRQSAPRWPADEAAPGANVLLHVLDSCWRLLHPVMPFITEDLWAAHSPSWREDRAVLYPERDRDAHRRAADGTSLS